jgi:hypothetical protein
MFTINSNGTREGVAKVVSAATAAGEKPTPEQVAQVEAAKAFILAGIKALPEKFNGCRVTATGEAHPGGQTCNVTIIPLELHL